MPGEDFGKVAGWSSTSTEVLDRALVKSVLDMGINTRKGQEELKASLENILQRSVGNKERLERVEKKIDRLIAAWGISDE